MNVVTCTAPVNIATIKYWGKRDTELILPLNDSISVTLSTDQMHAKTTVAINPEFKSDRMWLNGKEQPIDNPRFAKCLKEIRQRIREKHKDTADWKVHICSENNFPTAAGLASSAAGYACLVYALSQVTNVNGNTSDISRIARIGSGSACRSVYGGFVQWHSGSKADGSDSFAEQLYPGDHWPQLRILVLVVNEGKKNVSSTSGMQESVRTSKLLKYRVQEIVPERTKAMIKAIAEKDFASFAEVTMQDSNQFHAVCLDTYPPIVYMSETSHAIIDFVHKYNKISGKVKVAYTFDAGPNACLFLLDEDVPEVVALLKHTFPHSPECADYYIRGIQVEPVKQVNKDIPPFGSPHEQGLLKYIIHTAVGDGPQILTGKNDHLLSKEGLPKAI